MYYLTGDCHGRFKRIVDFCERYSMTKDDVIIILGDAGFNHNGYVMDRERKNEVKDLPVTIFCIHGNHEQRPGTLPYYRESVWHGGTVYVEEEYPNILFAKDGEIYDFDGKRVVVIGGAYSLNWRELRMRHMITGVQEWWQDEQPDDATKAYVEEQLAENGWKVDVVLSHTVPKKYMPTEHFLGGFDQDRVDNSTEEWLETIEERLEYEAWYAGHFHCEKRVDRLEIMFENYRSL